MAEKHESASGADKHRPLIEWELKDNQFADATLSTRAFTNIEYTEDEINKFVCQTPCYCKDTARWALPTDCQEGQLADNLQKILEQIISHFGLEQRTVYNTYRGSIVQSATLDTPSSPAHMRLHSAPSFSIQAVEKDCAAANNFPNLHPGGEGYAQVVSPIEVKTESNFNAEDHKMQVAFYARQIFRQQCNRQLVNCLIISEESIRLYSFGRDGLHYSLPFDMHANPTRFVRFILGAASTKAEIAGFDSTIFFRGGTRWIRSVDLQNNPVEYEVVGTKPVFDRLALGGRGTTCWKVKDSTGNFLLVKDSWQEPVLNHEYELLQDAKGLGGVGQIIGYQNGLASTHKLRLINTQPTSSSSAALKEKILCRVVMEYYGDTLGGFTSRKQLLEAFDDAISGYKNLHDKNILHRDISVNNILLGKPGAVFPNRGVLVDLDMAIRLGQKPNEEDKDRKAGTRTFQSVNILRSYSAKKRTFPHSYMDDLQSFFYVLCWICANYSAPNTRVGASSTIPDWEVYDAHEAAINKTAFYVESLTENVKLTPFFGEPFYVLLEDLQYFFKPYVNTFRIVEPPTLEDACNTIQGYVRTALAAVDPADSLKYRAHPPAEVVAPKPCTSAPESLPAPSVVGASSKKRLNGAEGGSFPSKKIKLGASAVPCNIS